MSRRPSQQPKPRARGSRVSPRYVAAALLIALAVVGALVFLSFPRQAQVIDISSIPSRNAELGETTAKVTITEYSDFR